jgi:hypothetical protein
VDEKTVEKLAKNFGAFTENVIIRNVPTAELENCEAVLDRARWTSHHAENSGAVKTIDVSADKNLQVVINAQQAAIRPYVSSMLVNASTGLVLMRLDTPREFSAYGIYLYPVGPASSAVISYPEF